MDSLSNQKVIFTGSFKVEMNYDVMVNIAKILKENNIDILISDLNKTVIEQTKAEMKIDDVLNLYFSSRNLKLWTKRGYVVAIRHFLKRYCNCKNDDWKNVTLKSFLDNLNCSNVSEYNYLYKVNSLVTWLCKEEIIDCNPCTKYMNKFKNNSHEVRAALNCEKWIDEVDAKKFLIEFFNKVKESLNEKLYRFLVLHFILGTRITETLNYIDAVKQLDYVDSDVLRTVYIRTKTTKNGADPDFRIPVPDFLYAMIQRDKDLYEKKFKYTTEVFLRKFLRKHYKDKFSLHGTRAVFRTTIDFLDTGNVIGNDAKESYINHKTDNYVQGRYHRNDHLIPRLELMCVYASFIYESSGLVDEKAQVEAFRTKLNKRLNRK